MIADLFSACIIAFAFFTVIPMPKLEWSGKRMRYVPLMMPVVGLVNGLLAYLLFTVLTPLGMTPLLKAVMMTLFFVLYTGGLHMDGLLDTADAYFSRRDKAKKLEIMKDSNVGAFAAITLVFVILLKVAVLVELFTSGTSYGILLVFIPVLSRGLQSLMLYTFPSAKAEGLTKIFGKLEKKYVIVLFVLFVMLVTAIVLLAGVSSILVVLTAFVYLVLFYFSSKRQFGGITGDLLGAFLEIAEFLMLGTMLFL